MHIWPPAGLLHSKMIVVQRLKDAQRHEHAVHVHIIYRTTTAENFLGSQISSAIAPDYCVTRRQRRWDLKQTMRANGDMDAFRPRLQYIRYLCSALDMTGGRLSSWPKMKLLITLEYTGFRGTANKLLKTDSLVEYSIKICMKICTEKKMQRDFESGFCFNI